MPEISDSSAHFHTIFARAGRELRTPAALAAQSPMYRLTDATVRKAGTRELDVDAESAPLPHLRLARSGRGASPILTPFGSAAHAVGPGRRSVIQGSFFREIRAGKVRPLLSRTSRGALGLACTQAATLCTQVVSHLHRRPARAPVNEPGRSPRSRPPCLSTPHWEFVSASTCIEDGESVFLSGTGSP